MEDRLRVGWHLLDFLPILQPTYLPLLLFLAHELKLLTQSSRACWRGLKVVN